MCVQATNRGSHTVSIVILGALTLALTSAEITWGQDLKPGEPGWVEPTVATSNGNRVGRSPFEPPKPNDSTFVIDSDIGLDTGCVFNDHGALLIRIPVDRVIGDRQALIENGLISQTAKLTLPAFDVDYFAVDRPPGVSPQRDRVKFNNNTVPREYLTGVNGSWVQNVFEIPIEWIVFPSEPSSGALNPEENLVQIDIDTANSDRTWCVEVDWVSLEIDVARPVVMAHGILSDGDGWRFWAEQLASIGLPNDNSLNMGNLDGIASNAEKIGSKVEEMMERWGVDKVNLVTHSKGGIDGRHYVENADNVEQLIQIGTPNAGSPLANYAQAILFAIGAPGVAAYFNINELSGPAGAQLTTSHMSKYNRQHGFNPEIRYTAMAGNYRTGCLPSDFSCYPVRQFLQSINLGPSDLIVPKSSVHSLSYVDNREISSVGANTEATHSCLIGFNGCLTRSEAVFGDLGDRIQAFYTNNTPTTPASRFTRSGSEGGMIAAGETRHVEIPIDQQGNVFFSIIYPTSDVDLVFNLVSPFGQTITENTAAASPDIGHEEAEFLGGMMQVYNIGSAESGTWIAEISAHSDSGSTEEIPFGVSGWMGNSPITLNGQFKPPAIASGEELVFEAVVAQAGTPVTDADAVATVAYPDNSTTVVELADDGQGLDEVAGDGIYTGKLSDTAQVGMYRVVFRASRYGSAMGPDFSRELFDIATVSASRTTFSGEFNDTVVDFNGNGLFDKLEVEVGIDVTDAALYRVFGELADENDNLHHANVLTELEPGSQSVTLSFDGEVIFRNGVDGPYTLRRISMAEEDAQGLNILPVDELLDVYETQPYLYMDFEHAPLLLPGTGTSDGVDTDGNGLFEFLDVAVDVLVEKPGTYTWSATLRDQEGNQIGIATGSDYLDEGLNAMSFTFDGEMIGENGTDGPYDVTGLLLYGAGESLVAGTVFSAEPFTARQFEGFVEDSDDDGVPNDWDACPSSDLAEHIVIDGCDNGIPNELYSNGCTQTDLIGQCANGAKNHGQFGSCVTHLTNQWKADGSITGAESGMIQHCAAQASIP